MEKWKDIKGYEGYYQVSDKGRVRSLDRYINDTTRCRTQFIKGRLIKLCDNGKGYKQVHLSKNKKRKMFYAHRLVAKHFLKNYAEDLDINHKDFDRSNNDLANLELVTVKQNINYSIKHGRYERAIAEYRNRRLTERKLLNEKYTPLIIEQYTRKKKSVEEISKMLPFGCARISEILKENKIKIRQYKVNQVVQIKNGKIINVFDTINKAGEWLIENNYTESKYAVEGIQDCVNFKKKHNKSYGFEWQLL